MLRKLKLISKNKIWLCQTDFFTRCPAWIFWWKNN